MKHFMRISLALLALLLALSMLFVACKQNQQTQKTDDKQTETTTDDKQNETPAETGLWKDATYKEDTTLGEGAVTFTVVVTAQEKSVTFTINTDKETLGAALVELGLIEGTGGFYSVVNGMTADWNVDQGWWRITKDSVDTLGADETPISAGEEYVFTYTIGY